MNIREKILQAQDLKREQMHIEEWNTDIYLRALTLRERRDISNELDDLKKDPIVFSLSLFTKCVVDENGNQVFNDDDQEELLSKNGEIMDRVTNRILKVNGLAEDSMEEAEKNS